MKNNLKITVLLATILSGAVHASDGRQTPVTPHPPLRRISSSLGFSEQETWQQKLAKNISSNLSCTTCPEHDMKISGKFNVDERSWEVRSNGTALWSFSIGIKRLHNEEFELTVTNPKISYFKTVNKKLTSDIPWKLKTAHLSQVISELLRMLDPRSAIYGE